MNTSEGNSIYTCTSLSKGRILSNHNAVLLSVVISTVDEDLGLPRTYWIPKLHKDPYKQRYIASSAKCSTKSLSVSQILTRILTTVRDELEKYCDSSNARHDVN